MRVVKLSVLLLVAVFVFGFLHYTLPQHDIVRVVGTENRRIDIGENAWFWAAPDVGTAPSTSRDVFFINTVYPDGSTMEFRNEDTGWGWPPYFKMDSFSTQTEAKELSSSAEVPKWVAITHYGWRNQLFTIFPNAISVKRVEGPDVTIIPWVNIVILTFLAGVIFMIRRMWLQFRERMIEPAVIEAQEAMDELDARSDRMRDRAAGWFRRVFGRR
ncbi:MAG: hypothetical protein RIT14_1898 [Pseudomonadota bacterium]|jgi:hypothetical protein